MKIFFDCGTHYFQGFKEFKKKLSIDENWKIFCFEANPYTFTMSKQYITEFSNYDIDHLNKAVYINYNKIKINCALEVGGVATSQASNILQTPPVRDILYNISHNYIQQEVECIDFSNFLKENTSIDDEVFIKMDIEGAEFEVLEKIIKDGTYKNIKQIYIEFHERFFLSELEEKTEQKIKIIDFFKKNNILCEMWV